MTNDMQKIAYEGIDNELYIKRDDLYPFSFGGNKAKIAMEFMQDLKEKGKNCMVGYGLSSSNLNRAVASLCAKEGIPCHIIASDPEPESWKETYNSKMVRATGAEFHLCNKKDEYEFTVNLLEDLKKQGYDPYYINGNPDRTGNEVVPMRAYAKEYGELGEEFDYVFVPMGAAMTVSGLIAGKARFGGKINIVGISIARLKERGDFVVRQCLDAYARAYGMERISDEGYTLVYDYICDGYAKYNAEIAGVIDKVWGTLGIPLDPCYTGKAFWGMTEFIKKNNITGKKILFIHTGGTPLFFNYLESKNV